jgi:hypothetical protein
MAKWEYCDIFQQRNKARQALHVVMVGPAGVNYRILSRPQEIGLMDEDFGGFFSFIRRRTRRRLKRAPLGAKCEALPALLKQHTLKVYYVCENLRLERSKESTSQSRAEYIF